MAGHVLAPADVVEVAERDRQLLRRCGPDAGAGHRGAHAASPPARSPAGSPARSVVMRLLSPRLTAGPVMLSRRLRAGDAVTGILVGVTPPVYRRSRSPRHGRGISMEALVVVLGLVVVPALVAAMVVALVVARRKPAVPEVPIEELLRESAEARASERDAAVKTAIDHLVRMNEQMLSAERRLGTQDLEGKKSLIDHEIVGMRGDLAEAHVARHRHREGAARARRRAQLPAPRGRAQHPGAGRDHAVAARGAVEHHRARPVGRAHGRRRAPARRLRRRRQLPAPPARGSGAGRAASPTTRSCCRRASRCTWT